MSLRCTSEKADVVVHRPLKVIVVRAQKEEGLRESLGLEWS